jgi:hypothetical protein
MSNRGGVRLRPELCGPGMSKRVSRARSGAGLAAASGSWFSGVLSTRGPIAGGLGNGLVAASVS